MSKTKLSPAIEARRREEAEEERRLLADIERILTSDPWVATNWAVREGVADAIPAMVYRLWQAGEISDDELPDIVTWSWVRNRSPLRGLGERHWLQLFKAAGFMAAYVEEGRGDEVAGGEIVDGKIVTELVPSEYEHLAELPTEPIIVWRGAALATKGRGMSWSIHRECARDKFAQPWADAYQQPSGLYRATVPPRAILALFSDPREQEVVVNPNMLRGRVELIEEVEPDREKYRRERDRLVALMGVSDGT